jgi:putative component of membrane protein insertase Oxa1/YidC/SpoIIIJ protein YidD
MKRVLTILLVLGGLLSARPANPLSLGADMALGIYQKLISPLQGRNICNFSPTCSAFSRRSYRLYGPLWGTFMTFDRLQRCNPGAWRQLEVYYSHIENDKLYDPPLNHHLPSRIRRLREERSKTHTDTNQVKENGD